MSEPFASVVKGVELFLPDQVITNDDLAKTMDTSDEWIQERSGIKERRRASSDIGTSDMGVYATEKLLEKTNYKAQDLDLIVASTLSPDYYFPGIGVQIQDKIKAPHIPAIDLRAQCSGFVWGLSTVDAYIRSGLYKRVLFVCSEIHSKVLAFSNQDRNVSVLFGDGCGVLLIEAQKGTYARVDNQQRGIIDHELGSDGSGAQHLVMLRPGMLAGQKDFMTVKETQDKVYVPYMDGRQVFRNAVKRMTESAKIILKRNNLSPEDIDLVIPHQANLRINDAVRDKLSLPKEKVFNNIEKYGNTTAATIPICMAEAQEQGKLKEGMLVLTLAFGAGFTWGANLIRW